MCASLRGINQCAHHCSCLDIVYLLQVLLATVSVSMSHIFARSAVDFLLASLKLNLPALAFYGVSVSVCVTSADLTFPSVSPIVTTSVSDKVVASVSTSILAFILPMCCQVCQPLPLPPCKNSFRQVSRLSPLLT